VGVDGTCSSCGASPVSGRFCNECGTALGTAQPAVAPAPVAERRVCSVLFGDLAEAVAQHRELETHHLAHALLDLAVFRAAGGAEADDLITEAEAIAVMLPCPPLADRVAELSPVRSGGG
jgi:hypothetical protein